MTAKKTHSTSLCSPSDAPAHQHVELQSLATAEVHEPYHVCRLDEHHHRHRRTHPHLEGICPRGLLWVNSSHIHSLYYFRIRCKDMRIICRICRVIEQKGQIGM